MLLLAPTLLTNRITGSGTAHYSDFTPLGLLYNENVFISVKADSPVKSGRDLIERLRKEVARAEGMLANERFVQNAPSHVVDAEREKLERYRRELAALEGS